MGWALAILVAFTIATAGVAAHAACSCMDIGEIVFVWVLCILVGGAFAISAAVVGIAMVLS